MQELKQFRQIIKHKGLPYYDENTNKLIYGDLYIQYNISLPQKLHYENTKLDIDNNINYIIPSNINHCNKLTT